MNKTLVFLVFTSLSLSMTNSFAVDSNEERSSVPRKAWEKFKSPVTTVAKYPLLAGGGLTALLLVFEDQIIDPTQQEVVEHKPLGPISKIGDLGGRGFTNALYVVGMYGYGLLNSDQGSKQNAADMLSATVYSTLVTSGLKYTIREPRPDSDKRESFPSGHTTAAFAFASFVGCRHSAVWGLAAYSLAALVGFSRINDNRHYLHDVTAGAAIGTAYGIGVCLSEDLARSESFEQKVKLFAIPTDGGAVAGLNLRF